MTEDDLQKVLEAVEAHAKESRTWQAEHLQEHRDISRWQGQADSHRAKCDNDMNEMKSRTRPTSMSAVFGLVFALLGAPTAAAVWVKSELEAKADTVAITAKIDANAARVDSKASKADTDRLVQKVEELTIKVALLVDKLDRQQPPRR